MTRRSSETPPFPQPIAHPAGALGEGSLPPTPMSSYTSLEAALHDAFWAAEGEAAELPLLDDFLRAYPGPAIEVGCGSGRLLLPLLAAGHPIEGLDSSPDMLRRCRESAAMLGLSPTLHLADMTGFRPPTGYQAVAVPAFALQLAGDPAALISRFATWLAPGGGLFLTTFRPDAELAGELPEDEWFDDHHITLDDGSTATLVTRHTIDRARRLLDRRHRYLLHDTAGRETGRHESRQLLRWFEPGELESLVARSGFRITRRIAELDPAATPADAQILTLHAQLSRV